MEGAEFPNGSQENCPEFSEFFQEDRLLPFNMHPDFQSREVYEASQIHSKPELTFDESQRHRSDIRKSETRYSYFDVDLFKLQLSRTLSQSTRHKESSCMKRAITELEEFEKRDAIISKENRRLCLEELLQNYKNETPTDCNQEENIDYTDSNDI
ncbi:hypothetical protein SPOG_04724 [Schizosaccharomyces cryophilus OY26]|uniref:Uncharacterized protein n=1 Tax=Schizosaccharomyces cryophilus (strain OY26 / ATCC MYA-4695 / CBS 11777 / NBRC 106824 / NRRL Y48691) TaxID=653667 RepID=S9X7D7_SCHCR|nr:uncharacterized protein SPOG_04724 [Schizosaccharomyces cryophilus OY26]EPY52997.1 hypothetical protein SPOG_04724 [Schizosaccharomyces cryophilus OY26]